jgi:hypothetical protein
MYVYRKKLQLHFALQPCDAELHNAGDFKSVDLTGQGRLK